MSIINEMSGREFIYWPLSVKALIWLSVFLAMMVVGWFFFWSTTVNNYYALSNTERNLKKTLEQKIQISQGKEELRAQIPKINADFGELLRLLPSKASVDNLIFDLNQVGASKGITVKSIQGLPEEVSEYFVKVPVFVTFSSNFKELGRFVENLSRLPRIVTMQDFVINRASTDPADMKLNIKATANTYRNVESTISSN